MDPAQQHPRGNVPEVATPEMGERLTAAWEDGTLVLPLREDSSPVRLPGLHKSVLPASLSGPARAQLAGIGERFAAWRVVPQGNAPVIVRIPHVPLDEMHQDLTHEIAALTLIPPAVGPHPIAVEDDPALSPLGVPYVVTTEVPGTAAPPQTWTAPHLDAHARLLARLHSVPAPGRGPVSFGEDPWSAVHGQHSASLLAEVEAEIGAWRAKHAATISRHDLEPFLEAARERVAGVDAEVAELDGLVLAHGDLCATNIMWERPAEGPEPLVRYIDFEWAQGDDPARDLAIIGGPVHGGPWYLPLEEESVDRFVRTYAQARAEQGELPEAVADQSALRNRMRAWTAYERTAMLVHVASRADAGSSHREVLPVLRGTLARELGLAD